MHREVVSCFPSSLRTGNSKNSLPAPLVCWSTSRTMTKLLCAGPHESQCHISLAIWSPGVHLYCLKHVPVTWVSFPFVTLGTSLLFGAQPCCLGHVSISWSLSPFITVGMSP